MQCISTRAMVALGYERGEEFDPGADAHAGAGGGPRGGRWGDGPTSEPGRYERRRRRERRMLARVPEWFSADDLVPDGPVVIHGEPV